MEKPKTIIPARDVQRVLIGGFPDEILLDMYPDAWPFDDEEEVVDQIGPDSNCPHLT